MATAEIVDVDKNQLDRPIEEKPTGNQNECHSSKSQNKSVGKWFACDQCDKSFSRLDSLKIHKDAVHRGLRPHACDQCNKRFYSAQILNEHLRIHTGGKPFPCDQCNKTFTFTSSLKTHKRAFHQQVRPHACDQCGKRFFSPSILHRHFLTHTGNEI